ncbi:hypothetical protein [Micromonospora cremea]|uniref:Uncharacterized protein n=1 Tax=Micromonospora cremea TaxID=709881 RepID=A0A1N6B334_9ACTN|nr:hypothetical protein [Micromonospora cremea]SIN40770.1 hypothetical protein SAMN04489832_6613 [Micromonospora cremea]
MNPDLRELIVELRADLEADQPATLLWAQIGQGAPADTIPAEVPQPARELLEVADGVRAGDFELWGTAHVDYRRNMLGSMPEFTGVAEEPAEWYYLGDLAGSRCCCGATPGRSGGSRGPAATPTTPGRNSRS